MSKRHALTDVQLQRWAKAGTPIAGKSDGSGLTFTVSKAGTASWVFRYRMGGRQRELTLGNYPDLSLKAARTRSTAERARVDAGIDVAAEKRKGKLAVIRAGTFRELAEDYLERRGKEMRENTRQETRRYFDKDILPRIGHVGLGDLTTDDVVDLVRRIAKRSYSVARRSFEMVSVIMAHAVANGLVRKNVCDALRISAVLGKRPPVRPRVNLTDDQLRTVLAGLPALGRTNELALLILLATCARKSELQLAKREDVDLMAGTWRIPAENSKTGKAFVVPLAHTVVKWFTELLALSPEGSAWAMPSPIDPKRPTHESTLNAAIARLEAGVRFSPHDLRSTARSHLGTLGVDVIVTERCLNHALGGLVGIYDKADYMVERRRALELWASHIEALSKPRPWQPRVVEKAA